MTSTAIFVALELVTGLAFALLAIFLFPDERMSLNDSILFGFLVGYISMFVGIGLVGYFHLRKIRLLYRYTKAISFSVLGLVVFLIISILITSWLPDKFGALIFFLPLMGAVTGFNLPLSKR